MYRFASLSLKYERFVKVSSVGLRFDCISRYSLGINLYIGTMRIYEKLLGSLSNEEGDGNENGKRQ